MNKYDDFLIKTLQNNKFVGSGYLCELLVDKFGITETYGRKILERSVAKKYIKSSAPTTFGKGQFIYFLPNEKLSKDIIKNISKSFRPPLYRLLESIDINNGIISYYEALKITASPIKETKGKVDSLGDLLEVLKIYEILYLQTDKNGVKYIIHQDKKENEEILINLHYSKLKLDASFVKDIVDWLAKSNLILSLNNVYRNKNTPSLGALHNNLLWDAFGYTKTTGINAVRAQDAIIVEKQTLVVVDVLLSREYEQYDLDGFLSRIQIHLNSVVNGTRKVLPMIIYRDCSNYIINTIRSLGFLCYDIGSIYGSNIFKILDSISNLELNRNLLENEEFGKTIEDTLKTIQNSGQDDQLRALKGTLFEVLMYQVLKHSYTSAEIITNVYFSKSSINKETQEIEKRGYEYDYIIRSSNPKEIIIIELKGYNSLYQIPLGSFEIKNSIKWFFNRTLPFIKEKYRSDFENGYALKAVYITSSLFEPDALSHLENLNKGIFKPSRLDVFYDREKLLKYLESNDFQSLKNIIQKYYL